MTSTIKDISKDTGLSLGTISKYLNHKPVSEKSRVLIEESIRRLDYTPNSAAQALRSKSSHCICIFTPDISDYHFGRESNYIMQAMREKGYSTIIRSYSSLPGTEREDITFLENRQIDGVILFSRITYPPLLLTYLNNRNLPFVCMHQKPGFPSDFAGFKDRLSGRMAASHLLSYGHRKILLLGLDSYSSSQKIDGFLEICQQNGVDASQLSIILFPNLELLKEYTLSFSQDDMPSAVLFLDHFTSLPFLGTFLNQNAAPVSIVAFDDDEIFSAVTPPITVISQDDQQLGFQAASLLYRRISGDYSDFPSSELVSASLLERESVFVIPKE